MFPWFEFNGVMENRLPSVSVGLSLTLVVFLILTGQVGLYFWKRTIHSHHSLWIKSIIILIWVMQALEVALSCHMTAIAHSDDSLLPTDLIYKCMWEWGAYIGTSVITESLVHAFFISRIYILERTVHMRISMILCIFLVLEASFGITSMFFVIISNLKDSRHIATWAIPLWLGISIFIDILIAGSLYYILTKNSPYLSTRTDLLVQRLIKFSIQTGLITSLATGVTVGIWIAIQLDTGHMIMSFPMGGIYATCFMANLLAKESYFCHIQVDENDEYLEMPIQSIVFASNGSSGKSESTTLAAD